MKKPRNTKLKAQTPILGRNAKVLRQIAKPVPLKEIGSKKLGDVLAKMRRALHAEEDGVAIAAPQIGVSLRIFIVKGQTLALLKKRGKVEEIQDRIYINPEIIKSSKSRKKMEEGCLSIRYLYGQVLRHEKITIRAYDEKGRVETVGTSGLLSQIFQHEIDHLDGVLFTDKAENIRDIPPTSHE